MQQKSYKVIIGVCMEARRLDKIQEIFNQSVSEELLNYLYELTMKYT